MTRKDSLPETDSMPDHGTVYVRLMSNRLSHPLEETRELVSRFFDPPRDALLVALEEQLKEAYMAGVRDGFAQGVAVESLAHK